MSVRDPGRTPRAPAGDLERRIKDVAPRACAFCSSRLEPQARLTREGVDWTAAVCLRCLRRTPFRKADGSQRRTMEILQDYAAENGLEVWLEGPVAYALPPIGRTAAIPAKAAGQPVA